MKPKKVKHPIWLKLPNTDKTQAWRYFDGVFQKNLGVCAVGGILFLKEKHSLYFLLDVEKGTNYYRNALFTLWYCKKLLQKE